MSAYAFIDYLPAPYGISGKRAFVPMPVERECKTEVRSEGRDGEHDRSPGGAHLAGQHRCDLGVWLHEDARRRVVDAQDFGGNLEVRLSGFEVDWTG
jgi:hypothetical protein